MPSEDTIKEVIWRQLIQLIEEDQLFFPEKIRKRINDEARPFLEEFLDIMLKNGMLMEFRKKSLSNRIAHWIFKVKIRKRENKGGLLEIYVKGSGWEKLKKLSYLQITGVQTLEQSNTTLH